ncbi:cell cycle checkpoint control protein RAD9A isoform X2 [Bos taurus]|uniref:cell cycle checkpoint control protein RAD9A isoform X2 n=1 Tax=Bos taurus TaxID=9913 RepID=UPI000572B11E|nr:cell cycle checkpoint control protein RAD9A isoform X2 [Bos taurus]
MKCLVTGSNVKVLGKAVHSLSRIGDELYLEPLEDGLSLRTVNSSRSAYACFLFAPLFFQQYQAATPGQDQLRCKILMKSFLSVFRSLAMLEKTVEKCCISLNDRSSRLVVQLHCKYGVRKTHNLSFQDCESLQAVFDPALCPHVLRAPARVLVEAVLPFPPALAEVTLGIGHGRRVILRSYQEEEADSAIKAMVTEMSIGEEDFQQLQAQEGVAITFCLKEFRVRFLPCTHCPVHLSSLPSLHALLLPCQGLLSFAESANLSLSIHFDAPGRPAIFAIEDSLLDGHFVLATLSESDSHPQTLHAQEELQRPEPGPQAHSELKWAPRMPPSGLYLNSDERILRLTPFRKRPLKTPPPSFPLPPNQEIIKPRGHQWLLGSCRLLAEPSRRGPNSVPRPLPH